MANQIVVSAGAKVRNLSGVLTATSGVVSFLPIDVSLGIPQLDVNGKILVSQLPNSVMEYKGTWDISTNTPTLVNGTGNQGDVYLVEGAAVGGTSFNFGAGGILFFNGDQAIYSGSIWQRASGATGTVTSVAITESGDSLNITGSPIVNAGTINIGFNGTNLQYVNGAGNLTTFPILTGFVPYTGATANVDLGAFDLTANLITGATGSFASSGGSDTFAINHSSGGGIALNITKGGNGEGLYINKTSGSGNAATIVGTLEATTLVKSGGTSSQFLKADGTVDSNTYALDSLVVHLAGTETITGAKTFSATSLTLAPTSGGGTLNLKQDAFLGATNGYTSLTSSGSDFAIIAATGVGTSKQAVFSLASLGATLRTYTLPDANGTIALTSDLSAYVTLAGTETITGAKTFSGLTSFTNTSGINLQYGAYINKGNTPLAFSSGNTNIYSDATTNNIVIRDNLSIAKLEFNNSTQTYTFPAATGTIALTSDIPSLTGYVTLATTQTITGIKTFSSFNTLFSQGFFSDYAIKIKKDGSISLLNGYVSIGEISGTGTSKIVFGDGNSAFSNSLLFNTSSDKIYTFPNASGTIALTSDIPSLTGYVPYTGATGAVDLGAYNLTVNGISIGKGAGSGTFNTAIGYVALSQNTTGQSNSAFGAYSLNNNSIGIYNSALGLSSLILNTTGSSNVAIGTNSLHDNTTGQNNTAIGTGSGYYLTTGSYNTIVGGYAGVAGLDSNVILSDGNGNIRFQWDGTNILLNGNTAITKSGTITTNYLPKFTGTSTIGNSLVFDNGTNVGIGTNNPTDPQGFGGALDIQNASAGGVIYLRKSSATTTYGWFGYDQSSLAATIAAYGASNKLQFNAGTGAIKMTLDASGNLGLGVTPSASSLPTIENQYGFFSGQSEMNLTANAYYNSGFKYIGTGSFAIRYHQSTFNGSHQWLIAPSGTAGAAITFTQAMTLTAAGRLLLGTTTESTYLLDVNGTGRFGGNTSSSPLELANTTISNYIWMNSATGYEAMSRYSNPTAGDWYTGIRASAGLGTTASYHIYSSTYGGDVFVLNTDGTSKFAGAATFSSSVSLGSGATSLLSLTGTSYGQITSPSTLYYDVDTQIFRNTAGTERMRITSGGNVLIGTTTSAAGVFTLQVGNGTADTRAYFNPSNAFAIAVSNSGSNAYYLGVGASGSAGSFQIYSNTTGSANLTITSTGNVGIGASTPPQLLSLYKASGDTYVSIYKDTTDFLLGVDSAGLLRLFTSGSNSMSFWTNSTERMRIKSNGIINFSNVPTSASGLSSGDVYKSAGVLMIV
jgi:hypothetical protein